MRWIFATALLLAACGGGGAASLAVPLLAGAKLEPVKYHYLTTESPEVRFGGATGADLEYIGLAWYESPSSSIVSHLHYRYTKGDTAGLLGFNPLPAGEFIARLFENNGGMAVAEGPVFVVCDTPPPVQAN